MPNNNWWLYKVLDRDGNRIASGARDCKKLALREARKFDGGAQIKLKAFDGPFRCETWDLINGAWRRMSSFPPKKILTEPAWKNGRYIEREQGEQINWLG